MADLSERNRAAARAMMPEIGRVTAGNPSSGTRSRVTAVGTARNFAKGGAVHSDVKQDKAMVRSMVKPSAMKACGGKVMKAAAGGAAKVRRGGFPGTVATPKKSSGQVTTRSK